MPLWVEALQPSKQRRKTAEGKSDYRVYNKLVENWPRKLTTTATNDVDNNRILRNEATWYLNWQGAQLAKGPPGVRIPSYNEGDFWDFHKSMKKYWDQIVVVCGLSQGRYLYKGAMTLPNKIFGKCNWTLWIKVQWLNVGFMSKMHICSYDWQNFSSDRSPFWDHGPQKWRC